MDFDQFLNSSAHATLQRESDNENLSGPIDLSRTGAIEITRDLYSEAEARGMTLSELLECDEYDPSGPNSPLDAFERQLVMAGIRLGGKTPTTVEQFYQQAPSLLPEFMLREIKKGQAMRPDLGRLVASTTTVASNTYTPFYINTDDSDRFSLRPIGEGAEVPQLIVTEQNHPVNVADYGLALKTSYKALRYRTTAQFRVLLWYIGFKIQTDKIGMLVNTIINGDGDMGCYNGEFIAKNTSLDLYSTTAFNFQVVGWELDDIGDSAAFASALYDSLLIKGEMLDSLFAVLDSLQSQDDWISAFDASSEEVSLADDNFTALADTLFGRDSGLFDEGYWHKIAHRADSGSTGSAGDSASIAGWVWNTPQVNHVNAGTFGKYLDCEISGIGTGSGILSHSVVAFDAHAEQVIPGVTVVIRNLDQTSLLAVGATGADGVVSFNLNAGDYLALASAPGYQFDTYRTITVTGDEADTVYGSRFDPGAPPSPDLCRVYGFVYNLTGEPESEVSVCASLPSGVARTDGLIISPKSVSTVTDSDGYFFLDLIPSQSMTPSETQYELTVVRPDGTILRQRVTVPDADNWQLTW